MSDIAISVSNLSKTFRIPHERISTLRGEFVNAFRTKSHEEFNALENVSFEVKKGEFFGIIGRNGSGKSTLLKILAGVYNPDGGKVKINGLVSPFLELGIGFQPELSGRDNVYLNATVLGLTKKQIDEKFDDIVDFSELRRFIDQKIINYSSGMQVRLAFSVAIHANRDILLMDEVLAVGDSNFQNKCLKEFNKHKEQGRTVILVTHDITTIQKYCDRTMLLRNGKMVAIGESEEVSNKYIFQNMEDEKKRITASEKYDNKKEMKKDLAGNPAKITDVKFMDKNGEERYVYETGEEFDIRINFESSNDIKMMNLGIGMHSIQGSLIFGYNTQIDKYKIETRDGCIILHFNEFPILKGEYFINVSLFGEVEDDRYDYKPKAKSIVIYSKGIKNHYNGSFYIKHEWRTKNNIK